MLSNDSVGRWMTSCPIRVGPHDDVQVARDLFGQHGIRHLPVVDDGKLVGLLCERDLQVAELFAGKRAMDLAVIMAPPYVVSPKTPLAEAAAQMSERREDAAIVMDGDHLLGVFTTADALRVLAAKARHPEVVEAVALGAAAGAVTGTAGGPPGIVAGGVVGALVGAIAGTALEKENAASERRDRVLDERIGVTGSSLGAREAAISAMNATNEKADAATAQHLRAELLAEHAELELLVEKLQRVVEAGDCKALVEPWREFESGLAAHLAIEEQELFPAYARCAPDETRTFERAHATIRGLVDDLGIRIELHAVRAEEIGALLDALRAHRLAEEVAFYRWAEGCGQAISSHHDAHPAR